MNLSVIVVTFNGAHKITRLFQALAQQTITPHEIVVVVDGSTDETIKVLEKLKSVFPMLRIFTQSNKGRAAVRNNGARHANGDLLVFFDDDMLPEPLCIAQHQAHHTAHPGSILVGGICEVEGENDFQAFRASLSKKWLQPLQESKNEPMVKEGLYLTAANFSILRDRFFDLGGFDEQLKDAEDYDLACRAGAAGVPVYYNHAAFAWHNDTITGSSYIKRLRQYKAAHQALLNLKPALYGSKELPVLNKPKGIKRLIFLFFSSPKWVRVLDSGVLAGVIPRSLRFKLYDLIVTANGVCYPDKVSL